MALFNVPYVHRDQLRLWKDFWDGEQSKASVEANRDGSLGQSETVTARNKAEAAAIVRERYPKHVVIADAIERLGD